MALAPFPRTPQPQPRPLPYPGPGGPSGPGYPGGGGNIMFSMMQIMMKMLQMMMTQFRPGGGGQPPYGNPFGSPGGYGFNGPQQPSPFAYAGGQQSFFL